MRIPVAFLAFVAALSFSRFANAQDPRSGRAWSPALQARVLTLEGSHKAETFAPGSQEAAEQYALRAVRADSTYAPAWSMLAMLQAGQPARTAALRSIKLDS